MNWEIITEYPSPELERKWLDLMPDSTFPCCYTSPNFFKEPFWTNQNPFAVLILDDEKTVVGAVTGLYKQKQIICGLAVRPQVTISKRADQKRIASAIRESFLDLSKKDAEMFIVHSAEPIEGFKEMGFREKIASGSEQVVRLDLSKGADTVFKNFSQSRRADLRKAMRENRVQVSQLQTESELAELYKIHINWCAAKQITPDSWEMMQKIFDLRDESHRIFIAKHDGKVIAGSYFRFLKGGLFEYVANNSMPEFRHLRPNDLLVWKAIEWACDEGFQLCSLGASHLFLRRFGGEIVSSYRYALDLTFLKRHQKKEAIKALALKTYQSLPMTAREKIKRIAGRG